MTDALQCPECGWIGEPSGDGDDDGTRCPICEQNVEFVD